MLDASGKEKQERDDWTHMEWTTRKNKQDGMAITAVTTYTF